MTVRIAILGGGIGGLATAALLRRAGLSCTVYEQATALTRVGAGLLVTPNAARLVRRLGVFDRLREHALRLDVGWDSRLTGLIDAAGTLGRWALLDRPPLPRWPEGPSAIRWWPTDGSTGTTRRRRPDPG